MATIYLLAGHGGGRPGAIEPVRGRTESALAIRLRDDVTVQLRAAGLTVRNDDDRLDLKPVLDWLFKSVRTSMGDRVIDIHFNSTAKHNTASGTEAFYPEGSPSFRMANESQWRARCRAQAQQLSAATATALGLTDRGPKPDSLSHHKRLGVLYQGGICSLLEVCFINNEADMAALDAKWNALVSALTKAIRELK